VHGMIFSELQNYAETKHGPGTWSALLKKAKLENRVYLSVRNTPMRTRWRSLWLPRQRPGYPLSAVLEDFGQFIVPSLLPI